MRRVAVAAGLVVVLLAIAVHPGAQVARSPALAKIVPGYPSIVTLDLPANDFSTFETVRQVLDNAEALYGIEGPVPTDGPPVDFAQRTDRTITLTGLTVGAALDAIAKSNPHFRWSDSNGPIVARLAPEGAGLLDKKLERYVLAGASPREALQTLLTALDPNRPSGVGLSGMGRPAMGREGAPPTRVGKNVTLALQNTTVVAALTTVARENGAMSWSVQYDHAPADVSSATIIFTESGEMVTAVPLEQARAAPTLGLPSGDLAIGVSDVTSLAANYARASGIRIGIETLPLSPLRQVRGLPPIRVANLTPAQALARIVAYDSRYEWAESKGVYYVRPKSSASDSPLNKTIESFAATNEALDSVMRRIVSLLAPGPVNQPSPLPPSASPMAQQMAAMRARAVTVSLRGPSTIRDVLDAVTNAAGFPVWLLRTNTVTPTSAFFDISLQTSDQPVLLNWPFTAPIATALSGPMAASVAALPSAVAKREIDRLVISLETQPSPFARLAMTAGVAMGIEMLPPPAPSADPRMLPPQQSAVSLGPGSFGGALATLLDRLPEYEVGDAAGVVSVAPREFLRSPSHFLNVRIGKFEIRDVPIRAAIVQLRQRMNPKYPSMTGPGAIVPGGRTSAPPTALMYGEKPLTLSLENPTPREVLNALVAQQGDVSWTVTYESSVSWVPAQAREADCAITLNAFPGGGLNARFPRYVDPAAPPPPPRPESLPPSSIVGPRLTIALPLTPRTLRTSVLRVLQATRTPIGIEMVTPYEPGAPARPLASTNMYDLTGLTVEQALDKIVGFLPDYSWQKDGGVYHVRPKALVNNGKLPFDRRIDTFTQQFDDVRSAMYGVLALVDPRRAAMGVPTIVGSSAIPDRNAQYTNRPIAVDLKGATIREILDAIILKHGDMWWSATYTDANGTYPQVMLEFVGFDGWTFGSSAAIR